MTSLLGLALGYAAEGQPVFPCQQEGKQPATRNGFKDATLDEDLITRWWEISDYNIGLPTGIIFDAIDVDGLEGSDALEEWADGAPASIHRLLTPRVLTPSGGYHIYIAPTGQGNRAGMLPHVDYRGVGGYVLGVGSRLPHGEYRCY